MKQPKYPLRAEQSLTIFEFTSIGPKGEVQKIIEFTETNLHGFFNLAFGDKDKKTGRLDDKTITNNSDTEKVLATVVAAVYAFTDKYPDCWVYATGSTTSRTRLYRMGISKFLEEAQNDFQIFGELNDTWVDFEKNVDFQGFAIKRKKS